MVAESYHCHGIAVHLWLWPMSPLDALLYALALAGHASIWIAFTNHIHSRGMPRKVVKLTSKAGELWMVLGPFVFLAWAWPRGFQIVGRSDWAELPWGVLFYFGCCWFAAVGPLPVWIWSRVTARPPAALKNTDAKTHDLRQRPDAQPILHGAARLFDLFPGNEMLQLEVNAKTLEVPGLPQRLNGLIIAHFSDLHMNGRVGKAYFHDVVDLVNAMRPDLVAVTGDLVDRTWCIDWLGETLGRIESRCGNYFVLGNHDKKVEVARVRLAMADAGFVDLASRWLVSQVDGQSVLLAGNELPWFREEPPMRDCPLEEGASAFRLLLAHTPDQYAWARERRFDLMLAGHTHGGQISLPLIGPIMCPSRHGVKYAGGVFHEPPTVLHVSRGASADVPIRWNCPPEITRLVLRCPVSTGADRQQRESVRL